MKIKYLFCVILLILVLYSLIKCQNRVEERCILPNGYKGFFVVFNQNVNWVKNEGVRTFKIPNNGLLESHFKRINGVVVQRFEYENGENINDIGFVHFNRLDLKINEQKLKFLMRNPDKLFCVYFYGQILNDEEEGFSIYLVARGEEMIRLLKNNEKQFFYISGRSFVWNGNKLLKLKNVIRLNRELNNQIPPFD